MDRLTDNIWRRIFRHSVDSLPGPVTFNPLDAPVLLTHVCRHWRLLALYYPYLWRSLRLRYSHEDSESVGSKVGRWAQRIKGLDFSLCLENCGDYTGKYMLETLRPVAANLTSLVLINIGPQMPYSPSFPSDPFPALERLVVKTGNSRWDRPYIGAFQHAPALHRVAFGPHHNRFMPLPWDQLTHVIEIFEDEEETWRLIEQMVNIRYLVVVRPFKLKRSAGLSWEWPSLLLTVDSLECLTVNACDKDWIVNNETLIQPELEGLSFLDHFQFPNLRSLRLMMWSELELNNPDAYARDTIPRFLGRLKGYRKLEYFSLSCDNVHGLDKLFGAIPTIKTLDIHLRRQPEKDSTALFEALTIKDGSEQYLLPRLQEVVIDLTTSCRWGSLRFEELLAVRGFLISRLERLLPGANFKLVLYGTDPALIESYVSGIDDLIEAGICCEVYHIASDMGDPDVDSISRWWMLRDPELKDWPEALDLRRCQ